MKKTNYEKPILCKIIQTDEVVRTSDLYSVDEYDPNEWQDVNMQA